MATRLSVHADRVGYLDNRPVSVVNRYGFPFVRTAWRTFLNPDIRDWAEENGIDVKLIRYSRRSSSATLHFKRDNDAVLFKLTYPDTIWG
jgi:hypothetical protein